MNSLAVAGLICATLFANCGARDLGNEEEWQAFKSLYKKDYKKCEEEYRRAIWRANLKKIEEHNKGNHSFTLAMNQLGDLTPIEFRQLMLGTRYRGHRTPSGSAFLPPRNVELPATVDWRTKGYVTPVKDQKQCGSCWAFSATGSLEGQHFKKTQKLVSLSEQNLVDCSVKFGTYGCHGGYIDDAFKYIKANDGIDTEASYPYTAKNGTCKFKIANVGATCTGYTDIQKGSEADLQSATATVGPISVTINAGHMSFQFYHEGVYNEPRCTAIILNHAVLVVGYGTLGGQDYWLVKNSWGTSWGMKGYIMMSRNKHNQCGIASLASYPLV